VQIGEFAKLCQTRISVLRHYDRAGLLIPAYTDPFTGYRHYRGEQLAVFRRISALKQAGFSLSQIRTLLKEAADDGTVLHLFDEKERQLRRTLQNLEEARKMMTSEMPIRVRFIETDAGTEARTMPVDAADTRRAQQALAQAAVENGFQRITGFRSYGQSMSNRIEAACTVIRLRAEAAPLAEDTHLPFADDPSVVGKWEVLGEYAVKEDFFAETPEEEHPFGEIREIVFLPGGERYWCYSWTKGKLLFTGGDSSSVNEYTVEEIDGQRYMFVGWKSYEYRRGGEPAVLVLRQKDNRAYTADELARRDDMDLPFAHDPAVLGKWRAVGLCPEPEEYDPERHNRERCFFSEVEFFPDGEVVSLYGFGSQRIAGRNMQTWTKGFVLRKWNETACAYRIREVDGTPMLFIQWKSGDYIWGGIEPMWYAFVRA